mmetsp:Transcript_20582/g.46686  ORF Transcript_20582/g.46686 Transcript_20582/m.46686 type:complete len:174 (-) Transcript_20582:50-571(-)|eukprot:CAMPEP_0113297346 /NCGR_PEP_ID=MMETSP0010_2-20120614/250_1 /TAXON_ID=216773 ORGANISM="Corethron hystrix, Strain 308" /NCGR_SAMPLE_ID=MMETSP0010_2 /ASSEMBLY_ACC=CAM_ASM_000155 /LENGTH=173 /DNA_ID=CAMNT_0000150227 /DNA_START=89 /DNA_END=610 /DNA_ORIENTATION=- /assembly_acc=CAM_ASM_000155
MNVVFRNGTCILPYLAPTATTRALLPVGLFQQVRGATKKAGGSSNNGRDSAGRRLGLKIQGGQIARPGNIIARQRGTKWHPGLNVGIGKDHTLFSLIEGRVVFDTKKGYLGRGFVGKRGTGDRKSISVLGPEDYARRVEMIEEKREMKASQAREIARRQQEALHREMSMRCHQ